MPQPISEQIRERFRHIQDVKFASARPEPALTARSHEPDIVVETWMNSHLHIYLLAKAPKPRQIKSILKQNTSGGIGTLFLVDVALLPGDGYCGRLRDWQDDLRVMTLGAIYAYSQGKEGLRILQVNLDESPQRGEFMVWHSGDFPCDAVSVRRRDYQTNIRGSWFVGDIASQHFKRRISEERARQRFHYRSQGSQGGDGEPINAAYLALEIEVGAGQAAVKEAFRKLAREYHPDVSAHDKGEAERRFKEVKRAYDRIRTHRRWR
ncbi:MAG: DnaJ domain-containing protein [Chloroflexi bacterium]|nr:DnaJ domain-containing protein [Chloroflexota bacterium]